jgi:L-2-hydroxyglutarate oxidase
VNRFVVVGGGIVGLATARALLLAQPGANVTVIERESGLAQHQTGRNSGVIHSGIYYAPGSAKAVMCRDGAASIARYAREHGIPVIATGKLILATSTEELPRLRALHERGVANGIEVHWLERGEALEYEPHCACVAAVRVPATSITDYPAICQAMARDITDSGGVIRTSVGVTGIVHRRGTTIVQTTAGTFETDVLVNCGGLQSDRIAAMDRASSGLGPATGDGSATADPDPDPNEGARIVPFRGEYYQLRGERSDLVRGLIYPVPDPDFPFLGVHLTKMVDGSVHAGPNAVLALAREGYDWRTVKPRDLLDVLTFGGFWQLARRNYRQGLAEVGRSLSKKRFADSLARLVPAITADDLVPSEAGVRAQALRPDGGLVDDFLIVERQRAVHVLNAPSPAATSSLEIGRRVAELALARTS